MAKTKKNKLDDKKTNEHNKDAIDFMKLHRDSPCSPFGQTNIVINVTATGDNIFRLEIFIHQTFNAYCTHQIHHL